MAQRRRSSVAIPSLSSFFEGLRSDYNATKASRFRRQRTGYSSAGSGADYHYRSESDYLKLIEQARDMDRNDVLVGQTVDRAVINEIQDGIRLDVQTGDPEVDKDLMAYWTDWAGDPDQCDASGELSFYDMEKLVSRHTKVDGDILALPLSDGSLQLIEGHRLKTPNNTKKNVIHGVLLDDRRRRLEYWLTKDDIDPYRAITRVSDVQAYPARDDLGNRLVFHIYHPKRVSQTRGITAFAPIFDMMALFEDINFAKLIQQQVVSCFAVFRERDISMSQFYADSESYGDLVTEALSGGGERTIDTISPGMQVEGLPGEKLHGFSPNVPNQEFFQHMKLIMQLIGVNLGLPLVLVLLDASETNFSGWRGAVDQARMGFKCNQMHLVGQFHRLVYRWKLRQWITSDVAIRSVYGRMGEDIFAHRWNPPNWPYIEPLNDAKADELRLSAQLTSPRRLHAERGRDFNEISDEIVSDYALLISKALTEVDKITKKFPNADITWRDLIGRQEKPLPEPAGAGTAQPGGNSNGATAKRGTPA